MSTRDSVKNCAQLTVLIHEVPHVARPDIPNSLLSFVRDNTSPSMRVRIRKLLFKKARSPISASHVEFVLIQTRRLVV